MSHPVIGEPTKRSAYLTEEPIKLTGKRALHKALAAPFLQEAHGKAGGADVLVEGGAFPFEHAALPGGGRLAAALH